MVQINLLRIFFFYLPHCVVYCTLLHSSLSILVIKANPLSLFIILYCRLYYLYIAAKLGIVMINHVPLVMPLNDERLKYYLAEIDGW